MQPPSDVLTPGDEVNVARGLHGDRGTLPVRGPGPRAPAIAVSREAGARGGSIARRVGKKLGWQVYDQELLEYLGQDGVARQGLLDALPRPTAEWAEARLGELLRSHPSLADPALTSLARVVLALGAQGEVVLIGRGAGCMLPRRWALNVRVVAHLDDRIAYMGQWLRLPVNEAAEKVRQRDARRAEFLMATFGCDPAEVHQYDLLLNSSLLGEETCADLVVQAARARSSA
jgi:cytidylate kinase